MKRKLDFVTNSSSTSFIFIFKGTKRTDLFKELVKREKEFDLTFDSYNGGIVKYDVWDLINHLIDLIKQSVEDPFYLPEIHPITKVLEDLERTKLDYEKWLEEELKERKSKDSNKISSNDYMIRSYKDNIKNLKKDMIVVKKHISSGKTYSAFEVSAGNDGSISGAYGDAMEQMRPKFDDEFYIIIENNH